MPIHQPSSVSHAADNARSLRGAYELFSVRLCLLALAGVVITGCTEPDSASSAAKKGSIQGTFRANNQELKTCYESVLNESPGLAGEVVLQLTIAPSGAVDDAQISRSTLDSAELDACLLSAVAGWQFPELDEPTVVNYPLKFRPVETALPAPTEGALPASSSAPRAGALPGSYDASGLDPELVRATVRSANPHYLACYEAGLAKNPALQGTMTLGFTVLGDGGVQDALAEDIELDDADVVACIIEQVGRLHFPAHGGEAVQVSYPLTLTP